MKFLKESSLSRFLPLLVFVAVASVGVVMTSVVYRAEEEANLTRFEALADEAVDRIGERLRRSMALLRASHAFFSAKQAAISRTELRAFVADLKLNKQFDGLQGLGFARFIPREREPQAEAELEATYGKQIKIWPKTQQKKRAVIMLLEPQDMRNKAALGFDMYSEKTRRDAMNEAIKTGEDIASAPVQLVQEITDDKQTGFLIYTPLYAVKPDASRKEDPTGFVYAAFRAGDLHRGALDRALSLPLVIETRDTSNGHSDLLYRSKDYDAVAKNSRFEVSRKIAAAGRVWTVTARETAAFFDPSQYWRTGVLALIFLMLAVALAAVARLQVKAVKAAREIQNLTAKAVEEKDLLLHETKHRIKNSLTRILAMARQTALHSETVEDFSQSFEARMQAMANAQDLLTGSRHQRADLRTLLRGELRQVFGDQIPEDALQGPSVELNETATQALGLTFHELATNALKYGGVAERDGSLVVKWEVQDEGRHFSLEWLENRPGAAAEDTPKDGEAEAPRKGFGTRLIDASIRLELNGTINRDFSATASRITISFPLVENEEEDETVY